MRLFFASFVVATLLVNGQTDAKYSISGRVVDDIYEQPVGRARLVLEEGGLTEPVSITGDDRGAFSFRDLRSGRYRLHIEKTGFFDYELAEVEASEKSDIGALTLITRRTISGRAKWRDGAAAKGVVVQGLVIRAGRPVLSPSHARPTATDDRGEFRLANMRPGRYLIHAYFGIRPDTTIHRVALPVTYPDTNVASSIDLRQTNEVSGTTLIFDEKPGVAIEGEIVSSPNAPEGSEFHVSIMAPSGAVIAMTPARAGKTFRLSPIPPGEYLVQAFTRKLQRFVFPLMVREELVRGLKITMPTPAPILGTIEMDEGEDTTSPVALRKRTAVSNLTVRAQSERLGLYGRTFSRTDSDGVFRLQDTVPGEAYAMTIPALPPDTYIARVTQGSRDLTAEPLSIVANADRISVLLKKDGGTVYGSTADSKGLRASFVILAPKNREAEHLFRTAETAVDGSFRITGVAPGSYDAYALDKNDEDRYLEAGYLQPYRVRAHSVEVKMQSSAQLTLEISKVQTQ